MTLFSVQRDTPSADLRVQLGAFWLSVERGDEAILGFDAGPFHAQSSVDLGPAPADEEADR